MIQGGEWLTCNKTFNVQTNNYVIDCDYQANADSKERIGKIRVTAQAYNSPQEVTVTQAAAPVLTVMPQNQDVGYAAGTTSFTATVTGGTLDWKPEVSSGGDWLQITGTDAQTITCSYTANSGSAARTGKIRVMATGASNSPQEVTVTQAAAPILSVMPQNQDVGYAAGTTSFTVTVTGGTLDWKPEVTSGADWLAAVKMDDSTLSCSYAVNSSDIGRTGKIRVTAPGAANSPQEVTVTQAPAPKLNVTPSNQNVGSNSGAIAFSVSVIGGTVVWTPEVVSGSEWLTVSKTDGTTLLCSCQTNTATKNRTGKIHVIAVGTTNSPKELTVTQIGAPVITVPVPDTGQTKCYDSSKEITCPSPGQPFYGQDANYSINPMSYTKLDGSGNALPDSATLWVMVKDNVTGLIWEMKNNEDDEEDYRNPHDADNKYTWYDSNPATNGGDAGISGYGPNTEYFIKALNDVRFGGYSDWRLPTIKELAYIVNFSVPSPGPTITTEYFHNTVASSYWSATTAADYGRYAWFVDFVNGSDATSSKSDSFSVRAVRGGQSGLFGDLVIGSFDTLDCELICNTVSVGKFADNGNGTITDISSGLMWQQDSAVEMTWEDALDYCGGLNLGGYTDWRLPTIKELSSFVDYNESYPGIHPTYWSATTNADNMFYAWNMLLDSDVDNTRHSYDKRGRCSARAVRGGQPGSLGNLVISPKSQVVPIETGSTTFGVSYAGTGSISWTAVVTSGSDWLSITSGASGTNTGTITCSYTGNTTTSNRTATILVKAATGMPVTATVTQVPEPSACAASLDSNLNLHIPYLSYGNGAASFSVDLAIGYNPDYPVLIPFGIKNVNNLINPSFSCTAATLSSDFKIYIPDIVLPDEITHLWMDLAYSPILATFYVTDYGVVAN